MALPLRSAGAAAPNHGERDNAQVIGVCTDDTPETAAAFVRSTAQALAASRIRLLFRCPPAGSPRTATFVADEDGISLLLAATDHGQSTRRIPWLRHLHRPLEETMARGKATTIGLFFESLTADLDDVHLRPLPTLRPPARTSPSAAAAPTAPSLEPSAAPTALPPASPTPVLETPWSLGTSTRPSIPSAGPPAARPSPPAPDLPRVEEDRPVTAAPPPPPARALPATAAGTPGDHDRSANSSAVPSPNPATPRSAPRQRGWELSLPLAGVDWMPPSTVAPQFEAGIGWGGPRWWAIAHGLLQLDSNFAMDWRTFHTAGYGLRVGIRRTLIRSGRFRWDGDATVAGHLSQYRRDGITDAQTHDWFDLGAGLHSRTSVRLARHTSLTLMIGAQLFPTAREASVAGGPSRRINLVTLSALGGLAFDF
jgi:hypothetical protein